MVLPPDTVLPPWFGAIETTVGAPLTTNFIAPVVFLPPELVTLTSSVPGLVITGTVIPLMTMSETTVKEVASVADGEVLISTLLTSEDVNPPKNPVPDTEIVVRENVFAHAGEIEITAGTGVVALNL